MRILVTGASGFVGRHLTPLLLKRGHQIYAVGMETIDNEHIHAYEADIRDYDAVVSVMEKTKPDAVVHLAAISNVPFSWEKSALTVDVNALGTVNVLEALRKINPKAKLLSVGSSDEYGLTAQKGLPLTEDMPCKPQNPYAISKYCAEQLALKLGEKYGMNVICTRSFNHFGAGQAKGFVVSDFASQIAAIEKGEQEPVMSVGDLTAERDFLNVNDVVEAYAGLVDSDVPSGVYNVCSGKARSIRSILEILLSLAKTKIDVKKDAAKLRPSDTPFFVGDASKLRSVINWRPQRDVREGLANVLEYWRNSRN